MMLSGEALRAAGMFDEQFFGNGEDLDLSLRMRKLGYVVRYAPMAKVWHREGVDYKRMWESTSAVSPWFVTCSG